MDAISITSHQIRHYASYSTELIVAIRTHAVLNPILATALPITISIPPRTNAPVEALRLSLLGVAAVHQVCSVSMGLTIAAYYHFSSLICTRGQTLIVHLGTWARWLSLRLTARLELPNRRSNRQRACGWAYYFVRMPINVLHMLYKHLTDHGVMPPWPQAFQLLSSM